MESHIVIVRTGSSIIDTNTYNCQELGLAKALARRGMHVSLVMADNQKRIEHYPVDDNKVEVYYLPIKSIDMRLGIFLGISNLLKTLKPTILQVHDMGIYMSWWVSKWAKRHNIPCYLIQGVYQTTPKPVAGLIDEVITRLFGRSILKSAAGVGCKSYMASDFVKKYFNRPTSIVYVGLDESKFEKEVIKDWRKELGVEDKKVLLYIGKMENRRNPFFLLDILSQLSEEYVLILVGKGSLFEQTKEKVQERNLSDRVFMLGKLPQHELPSIYAASDLFLLASSYEIYGMVIMESMFFGVPVLSSHSGGAEIIIDNQVDGIVEDTFEINNWVRAIERAFEDKQRLNQMGDAAKHKIKEKFLWNKTVDSFIKLYGLISYL